MNKRLKSDIEFLNDLNRIAFYEEGKNKSDKLVEEVYDYYNFIKDIGTGALGLGKLGANKLKNAIVGDINKSLKDLTRDDGFFQKIFYDPTIRNEIYNMFDKTDGKKVLSQVNNTGKIKRGKDKSEILADAFVSKIENMSTKQMMNLKKTVNPKKLEEDAKLAVDEADLINKAIESLSEEQKQLFKDINDDNIVVGADILEETKAAFEKALIKQKVEDVRAKEIVNEFLGDASKELELIIQAVNSLSDEQKQLFFDTQDDKPVDKTILDETKIAFEDALIKQKIEKERSIKIVKARLGTAKIEGEVTKGKINSKYTSDQINDLRNKLSTTDKDTIIDFMKKATPADETTMTNLSKILMNADTGITEDDSKIIITALGNGISGDANFTAENIKQLFNTPFTKDEFNRFFDILKPNDQAFKDLFSKSYKSVDKQEQKESYDKLKTALEKVKEIGVSTINNTWFLSNVENTLGEDRTLADEEFIKNIIDETADATTVVSTTPSDNEDKQKPFDINRTTRLIYEDATFVAQFRKFNKNNKEKEWETLPITTQNVIINKIKEKFPNITPEHQTEILIRILPDIKFPNDSTKSKNGTSKDGDQDAAENTVTDAIFANKKIQKIATKNLNISWDNMPLNDKKELINIFETNGIKTTEDHQKIWDNLKLVKASTSHNKNKMIEESIINYIEVLREVFDDLTEEELELKIREGLSLSEDYNIKKLLGGIE